MPTLIIYFTIVYHDRADDDHAIPKLLDREYPH